MNQNDKKFQRKRKREQEEEDAAVAAAIGIEEGNYAFISDDVTYHFCCYRCRCNPNKSTEEGGFTIDQNGHQYKHRLCCHNRPYSDRNKVWGKLPFLNAIEKSLQKHKNDPNSCDVRVLTPHELQMSAKQADRDEIKTKGEFEQTDPLSIWYSNIQNNQYAKQYNIRILSQKRKTRATVMELFAGMGSGLVALKRLGIDVKKVISVEHDEFANYVRKFNHSFHDKDNLIKYDDNIKKFEELEQTYDEVLKHHGAIDILIAGPPCTDFSSVNAQRKGVSGLQGSYLLRAGELVRKIKDHSIQQGHPLYVIFENVIISEKDGLSKVENYLGCTGYRIDAKYFSPCKRDRTYFTNFPTKQVNYTSIDAEYSAGKHFYKGDWMHPGEAFQNDCHDSNQTTMKANTFMASDARINDFPRMAKIRKSKTNPKLFEAQPLSVEDREQMMGLPDGYVSIPLKILFQKITNAFLDAAWDLNMPEMADYSGLPYSYKAKPDPPFFELKAGPPMPKQQKTQYLFTVDGYAKHLIGNALSIPVMVHLMAPLKELFASRKYEKFLYPFAWPPHNLNSDHIFSNEE